MRLRLGGRSLGLASDSCRCCADGRSSGQVPRSRLAVLLQCHQGAV